MTVTITRVRIVVPGSAIVAIVESKEETKEETKEDPELPQP